MCALSENRVHGCVVCEIRWEFANRTTSVKTEGPWVTGNNEQGIKRFSRGAVSEDSRDRSHKKADIDFYPTRSGNHKYRNGPTESTTSVVDSR